MHHGPEAAHLPAGVITVQCFFAEVSGRTTLARQACMTVQPAGCPHSRKSVMYNKQDLFSKALSVGAQASIAARDASLCCKPKEFLLHGHANHPCCVAQLKSLHLLTVCWVCGLQPRHGVVPGFEKDKWLCLGNGNATAAVLYSRRRVVDEGRPAQ